jgi:CBS domain-containing protein
MTTTAQDVMTSPVKSLSPEASLLEAGRFLAEHKLTAAPVVDGEGALLGIFSHSDLFRAAFRTREPNFDEEVYAFGFEGVQALVTRDCGEVLRRTSVTQAMTSEVQVASPTTPIKQLSAQMRSFSVHRVVIVERNKVVGIVSTFDLLELL